MSMKTLKHYKILNTIIEIRTFVFCMYISYKRSSLGLFTSSILLLFLFLFMAA
jgi:hypothetical protein